MEAQITITEAFGFVNWYAVLAATFTAFVIGGLWYAPFVFGRFWMKEIGFDESKLGQRNTLPAFIMAFALYWFSASLLAAVLGPNADMAYGLTVGLLVGAFFATTALGITYIFEYRSLKLYILNGAYHIVATGAMGAVIGAVQS